VDITLGDGTMNHEIPQVLRYEDLKNLFKISRSSLARWEKKDFPKRIQLGQNSIGWRADEVKQWLQERTKA
jgi:predicted DNA-binding transcriptional regulator AlpA